jgi:hypothetical protein
MMALPPPEKSRQELLHPKAPREFVITSTKKSLTSKEMMIRNKVSQQEDEVNSKIRKGLIVTILLKIQTLNHPSLNAHLLDLLLKAQKQYKDFNQGSLHNGIMAALKLYGDPDQLFQQYLQTQEPV